MPELPEVQTVVTTLQPLVGHVLGRVRILRRDMVANQGINVKAFIERRRIVSVRRQAKRIIIDLDAGHAVQVHLGMTGQLTVKPSDAPLMPHTHLCFELVGLGEQLRFRDPRRFGGIWLLKEGRVAGRATANRGRHLSPLGPDALEIRLPEFRHLLQRSRRIKPLLLDQQLLGGMGNIYVDESLFRAGIHPLRVAAGLSPKEAAALLTAIRRVLRAAIKAGGSSISDYRKPNGEQGWFQLRHQVYGRSGAPCRRCGAPIHRIQVGGRSSHVCPACQPEDISTSRAQ